MQNTRALLNQIIFGTDTRAGRLFDLWVIICIVLSVVAALLDSIAPLSARFHRELYALEWLFTGLFSVEYLLRLYSSEAPRRYAFSFFGVVDLLSILPTYLSLLVPGRPSCWYCGCAASCASSASCAWCASRRTPICCCARW